MVRNVVGEVVAPVMLIVAGGLNVALRGARRTSGARRTEVTPTEVVFEISAWRERWRLRWGHAATKNMLRVRDNAQHLLGLLL